MGGVGKVLSGAAIFREKHSTALVASRKVSKGVFSVRSSSVSRNKNAILDEARGWRCCKRAVLEIGNDVTDSLDLISAGPAGEWSWLGSVAAYMMTNGIPSEARKNLGAEPESSTCSLRVNAFY